MNNDMNRIAHDLLSVRAMIRELEGEAENLTDQLKNIMVEQGTEVLEGEDWKATWRNVSIRRFDSKSFRADHIDLYGQYSREVTTTRFVVSA